MSVEYDVLHKYFFTCEAFKVAGSKWQEIFLQKQMESTFCAMGLHGIVAELQDLEKTFLLHHKDQIVTSTYSQTFCISVSTLFV